MPGDQFNSLSRAGPNHIGFSVKEGRFFFPDANAFAFGSTMCKTISDDRHNESRADLTPCAIFLDKQLFSI